MLDRAPIAMLVSPGTTRDPTNKGASHEPQRDEHHHQESGDAGDPRLPTAAAAGAITFAVTSGLPTVLGSLPLNHNETLLRADRP
jgi:hypothetical protein